MKTLNNRTAGHTQRMRMLSSASAGSTSSGTISTAANTSLLATNTTLSG